MTNSPCILVVDDEPANLSLLAQMLARAGYADIVSTRDSSSAADLFRAHRPDLVLLDLHMPAPDGYDLLRLLPSLVDAGDFVPIVVLTADTTVEAKERALSAGAHDFLSKPFHYPELLLRVRNMLELRRRHRELVRHDSRVTAELTERTRVEIEEMQVRAMESRRIQSVIDGEGLTMVYQPVVDLTDGSISGAEALARFSHQPTRGPDTWFAEAEKVGLGAPLEVHAVERAMELLHLLPADAFLSVNASAATLLDDGFAEVLSAADLPRIVLELTEHQPVEDYDTVGSALRNWRQQGLRLAVDDTGSGFASLQHILRLAPDVIKLDRGLIEGIDADPGRRALVSSMVYFAGESHAMLIAEGIETIEELTVLRDLGVTHGQGYLMARPGPMPLSVAPLPPFTPRRPGETSLERLGHQLHDGPVQVLCAQSIALQMVAARHDDDTLTAELDGIIESGREAIREIGAMVSDALAAPGVPAVPAIPAVAGGGRSRPPGAVDYQAVFEQGPSLHLLLDPALDIIAASDAYLAQTMTTRQGIVGRNVFDVFPDNPDDPTATGQTNLAASLDRVRHSRIADSMTLQRYDVRRPEAEGGAFEERYWSPMNSPILSTRGEVVAIVHRVEDVSELVKLRAVEVEGAERTSELEEQAMSLEERLFLRTQDLERANERLVEVDRLKSDFLSRVSHELRTPLNAVIGFAQLLEMDELSTAQEEAVVEIGRAGRHLLDLINEVLDIAQIEAGHLNLSIEPVSLADLLSVAIGLVQPIAARRSVRIECEAAPDELHVKVDRQRALQILLNVLSNGVKYNHPGGRVCVAVHDLGDQVRISVADTGPGIAPVDQGRLFAPFERLGMEHTDVEGTGIGLMLARGLAERMACTLELAESGSDGSTFTIDLPTSDPPAPRPEEHVRTQAFEPAADDTAQISILYIEDNLSNLRLIDAVLSKVPGVELVTAMQGRLGVDLALEHRPNLVLLDVHLPDINGDEVLKLLKAEPATENTRVVFLSADATPRQIECLRAQGADGYLTKPIDIAELRAVVEESRP